MTAGRPQFLKNLEQIENSDDCECFINPYVLRNDDFKNEKDLQNFIINNIEVFCKDLLGDTYVSHECQININSKRCGRLKGVKLVDLLVECKNKKYIIELKHPRYVSETRNGICQLLDYSLHTEGELVLVTTKFDEHVTRIISEYNLPIRFFYINKKQMLEFLRFEDGKTN